MTDKVIIVANRLPVTASIGADGKLSFTKSNGGLVSGLSSLRDRAIVWVGWPGPVLPGSEGDAESLLAKFGYHPVFMTEQLSERFYEGYCNGTLWPLFHSMPSVSKTLDDEYEAFLEATAVFAREVIRVYNPGDTIWIQDYHLLMLPMELRRQLGDVTMAFFLHIPWPHVDVLRLLPNHSVIVDSVLQVDLAGFHTTEYVTNFIGCINRLRGLCPVMGRALVPAPAPKHGHLIQIAAFPMGIDFDKWRSGVHADGPARLAVSVRKSLCGVEKIVFSVSRLDYTKGVPQALTAVRSFLHEYPEWLGRVAFLLLVVPSRTRVEKYAELKREIDRLVGEINGEFGSAMWMPVIYMYRSLPLEELLGLYAAADVGLIIPLRDGMNLCAKEYVATHADSTGVLILSNLAGAARELIEAVIVNPNSTDNIVEGLRQAFKMPEEEQRGRIHRMAQRLASMDISSWTESIFRQLAEVKEMQRRLQVCEMDDEALRKIVVDFVVAKQRLLVLDYDGTLVPFHNNPQDARPDTELLNLLSDLAHTPKTTVLVLSGRDRHTLGSWLGHLPIDLAAEHGSWSWTRSHGNWEKTVKMFCDDKWKLAVRPAMEDTAMLLPGSLIEEKEFSIVFHYRACHSAFHILEKHKVAEAVLSLKSTLLASIVGLPLRVMDAKEAVEVKTIGSSKADFFMAYLSAMKSAPDFVLAIGDDKTDEDVFEAMPYGHSIRVGFYPSAAQRNVLDFVEVRTLLNALVGGSESGGEPPYTRNSFSI